MKFLKELARVYNNLEIEKPAWLSEADLAPMASQATPTVAGAASVASKSVVDSLMNAMKVIGVDNPNIQKAQQGVLQAKTNAEKVVTDASKKVIDKINQAVGQLTQAASTTSAATPTATTPGAAPTPSIATTPTSPVPGVR